MIHEADIVEVTYNDDTSTTVKFTDRKIEVYTTDEDMIAISDKLCEQNKRFKN